MENDQAKTLQLTLQGLSVEDFSKYDLVVSSKQILLKLLNNSSTIEILNIKWNCKLAQLCHETAKATASKKKRFVTIHVEYKYIE